MGALSGVNLHLVDTFEQAMRFKAWLGERRPHSTICVDTETTGMDPYAPGAAIRLIQFGDGMNGWALPWEFWKGLAVEALEQWEGDWVGHNLGSFDISWIEKHSTFRFKLHNTRDSMLAAHVVDPLGPGGLKPLSRKLIDPKAMAGEHRLKDAMVDNKWNWATIPLYYPAYWQYAALDTVLGWRIDDLFMKQVADGAKYAYIYDLEMATRFIVTRMQQRGARVDLEYCETVGQRLYDYAASIRQWGQDHYGTLLSSNKALIALFESLGEEITVFSERTGGKSVDKHQMAIFSNADNVHTSTIAEQVLAMRKAQKLASSYFSNILGYAREDIDGDIIHANIRTLGARTSRMSVGQPALQQLPKSDATVRRAFIAREGRKLVSTDFAQIEMRLLAHFSKDAMLQEAFKIADATGGDFFVEMGKEIYSAPDFSKSDKRRGLVKNTMYGYGYGAGIDKMAESAGVTHAQMEPVVRAIESRYPGLKKFMKDTEYLGREREKSEGQGYVITPYGRRLPSDEDRTYTLVNYLLQGHAAEIFKKSLIDLDASGWGEFMLLPVHDEIVMDVPDELVEECKIEVPRIMANTKDYGVPIYAESEGGFENWGQKYE